MRKQLDENMRQLAVPSGANYFEALAGLKRNQDGKDWRGVFVLEPV
jgi:hypothetical protein